MWRRFARLAVVGALGIGMNTGCAINPHLKSSDHHFTTPETMATARASAEAMREAWKG